MTFESIVFGIEWGKERKTKENPTRIRIKYSYSRLKIHDSPDLLSQSL